MRFQPRPLEGNVNVASTHPLLELAWLAGGLVGLLLAVYLALGLAVDWVAPRVPYELERTLGEGLWGAAGEKRDPRTEDLQELMDRVADAAPGRLGPVVVQVVDTPAINAAALPGGRALIFSGLLEQAGSENEVAMVLAHELGHLVQRDPLRALGRGLVLAFLASSLLGEERSVEAFVGGSLTLGHLSYSRRQEQAADRFAVETLAMLYGHVGGATAFFRRQGAAEADGLAPEMMATHPEMASRVAEIDAMAARRGYPDGPLTPIPEHWQRREPE